MHSWNVPPLHCEMTLLNDDFNELKLMPIAFHDEISVASVVSRAGLPDDQIMEKLSVAPCAMPLPHSVAKVPGRSHVCTPPLIDQPCAVSSALAPVGLYG